MLSTSKSDFVRRSDVNSKTSYYEMMNFVLQNDDSKIYMVNTSKPILYDKTGSLHVAKSRAQTLDLNIHSALSNL